MGGGGQAASKSGCLKKRGVWNPLTNYETYPLISEKNWSFGLPHSECDAINKTAIETSKTCYHEVRNYSNCHYPWSPSYFSLPFSFKYLIIGVITTVLFYFLHLQLHHFIIICQIHLFISSPCQTFFSFYPL